MKRACVLVGLVLAGCQPREVAVPPSVSAEAAPAPAFVDRVWMRVDGDLPGTFRLFLVDGTLVMDSCWETYRLTRWETVSPIAIRWTEDTATIDATVAATDAALVLTLALPDGPREERYVPATMPYVCPDTPR